MRKPIVLASSVVVCSLFAATSQAQPFANARSSQAQYLGGDLRPAGQCEQLNTRGIADVVEIAARTVAAEGNTPQHCRVSGLLAPEIAFEVNLPTPWNGRLVHDRQRRACRRGARQPGARRAAASSARERLRDGANEYRALREQGAVRDVRAVEPAEGASITLIAPCISRPSPRKRSRTATTRSRVAKAYWNSCSNGGRQGLIEAQRYPEDFDGIVANAPWVDQTGFTIGAIWNQRAFDETHVSADKLALVAERAMQQCDAVDGLRDGLIDDPRQCSFDVARDVPSCASGNDASAMCLTPAEAAAVQKVYDGPQSGRRTIFPGFMVGSEAVLPRPNGASGSGWLGLIAPPEAGGRTADFGLAEGTMRYLVFDPPQAEWDFRTFDFGRDPKLLERWGQQANATDTDLRDFRARGGKVLITYGWADAILQPLMGVNYYEKAVEANGRDGTDFMRLFMIPGMAHCAGGLGPDQYDAVTAVIDWVEKDVAPESLVARKIVGGTVTRSRPLCPYPEVARYKGQGSTDDAANFECRMP